MTSPLLKELLKLRPQMAKSAQAVYDDWDEEESGGGICDEISGALSDVIADHILDIDVEEGGHDGDDHSWLIVSKEFDGTSYRCGVDIPPDIYERGGGYSWEKGGGVRFSSNNVDVWDIDHTAAKSFESLVDDALRKFGG